MLNFNVDVNISARELVGSLGSRETEELKRALGISKLNLDAEITEQVISFLKKMSASDKMVFKMKMDSQLRETMKDLIQ
jgi:EAL domain-containing protein (putative c-di-GMP-specific phosphodiesterase class I)